MQSLTDIIRSTHGKIFRATFIKRSTGERRVLVGRLGVRKYTKGEKLNYVPREHDLIGVFDMHKVGYRMIPIEGLLEVKFRGKTYKPQKSLKKIC
jgi:hypothetical protein